MGAPRDRKIRAHLTVRWLVFATIAAFPSVFYGVRLGLPALVIGLYLIWGLCVAGISVELDRRWNR